MSSSQLLLTVIELLAAVWILLRLWRRVTGGGAGTVASVVCFVCVAVVGVFLARLGWPVVRVAIFWGFAELAGEIVDNGLNLSAVAAVARITFKEAVRKRVLVVVGLFILLLIATTPFFGLGHTGGIQLVERVSLAVMTFLGLVPVMLIAASGIPQEIESKRLYSVMTKPVSRLQYLAGRVIGVAALAALMLLVMGGFTDVLIRVLAMRPTVTVTARQTEARKPDGLVISKLSQGRVLPCEGQGEETYTVRLPEEQALRIARIRTEDVDVDRELGVLTVKSQTAKLFHRGRELGEVSKGRRFIISGTDPDWSVVELPEPMQVWTADIPRADASEPEGMSLAAERVISPDARSFSHEGLWDYDTDTARLHLAANFIIEGDTWTYHDIKLDPEPPGDTVSGWFHCGGLFGHLPYKGTEQLKKAELHLEIINPATGEALPIVTTARKTLKELVGEFTVPKRLLSEGAVRVEIVETTPATELDSALLVSPENRVARWSFEGLDEWSLPERVRVRLYFKVRFQGLPSNTRSARVPVKVINPSSGKTASVHEVMLQNESPLTFSFDKSNIDDGRVDIVIDSTPEKFKLQVEPDHPPVYLLARPRLFEFSFFKAVLLIFLQLLLAGLCAAMWSTLVSGHVAVLATLVFYFWGIMSPFVQGVLKTGRMIGGTTATRSSAAQNPFVVRSIFEFIQTNVMELMVNLFPNLARFSGSRHVLDGFDVPGALVLSCLQTTVVYGAVFFMLAWLLFRRREFH